MDCSTVMLDEARRVVPGAEFTHGDVCALKHADGAVDAVTTVYTLRNFPDLRRGVEEMYRVTSTAGARVVIWTRSRLQMRSSRARCTCGSSWSCPSSPDS